MDRDLRSERTPGRRRGLFHQESRFVPDLVADDALEWIDENKDGPFFLYFALNVPHANNEAGRGLDDGQEVPEYGIYEKEDWPNPDKGQAAMITRLDRDVGRVRARLEKHGIDKNTLILFSSDNGHHKEGKNNPEFFDANGPLRGMKRDLTEGGIRVPTLALWPGKIAPGSVSARPASFADFLATAADLAGAEVPKNTQSISFVPTLVGEPGAQKDHKYLYWEFYERGGKQAVRFGNWKAIRIPMHTGDVELYDLSTDLAELFDVACRASRGRGAGEDLHGRGPPDQSQLGQQTEEKAELETEEVRANCSQLEHQHGHSPLMSHPPRRFRKLRAIFLGPSPVVLPSLTSYGAPVAWDGGGAGESWNTADNWNPNGVPGTGDDVTVGLGASVTDGQKGVPQLDHRGGRDRHPRRHRYLDAFEQKPLHRGEHWTEPPQPGPMSFASVAPPSSSRRQAASGRRSNSSIPMAPRSTSPTGPPSITRE